MKSDKNSVQLFMNKMFLDSKLRFSLISVDLNASKTIGDHVTTSQEIKPFQGPRKMTIVLPKCDENRNRKEFRPLSGKSEARTGSSHGALTKMFGKISISDKTSLLGTFDEGNLEDITGMDKSKSRTPSIEDP